MTESIEAVKMSKKAGWGVMASHRRYEIYACDARYILGNRTYFTYVIVCSGETEDTFIADLSVGLATVILFQIVV